MPKHKHQTVIVLVVLAITGFFFYVFSPGLFGSLNQSESTNTPPDQAAAINQSSDSTTNAPATVNVTFQCAGNKVITATFNGSDQVRLGLDAGRDVMLSITEAMTNAERATYATTDGKVVLTNTVDGGVTLQENGKTTYSDCVPVQE